jgi:hypothetical protein
MRSAAGDRSRSEQFVFLGRNVVLKGKRSSATAELREGRSEVATPKN